MIVTRRESTVKLSESRLQNQASVRRRLGKTPHKFCDYIETAVEDHARTQRLTSRRPEGLFKSQIVEMHDVPSICLLRLCYLEFRPIQVGVPQVRPLGRKRHGSLFRLVMPACSWIDFR